MTNSIEKMEESKTIKRVGNYSTQQANPEDCVMCHNARFGTIVVGEVCLDCYEQKILEKETVIKLLEMAIPSLNPDSFEMLKEILDELCKTRHIPITIAQINNEINKRRPKELDCLHCGKIVPVNEMYSVDACSEECQKKIGY